MRHKSKPPTGLVSTFAAYKSYWLMKNDEQNGLSYHRIQRLIKEQIDRIEHETDAKTDERVYRDNLAKCSFIAIIKRFWSMKCLRLHKKRRKSNQTD